ncbi:hypothetical protein [Salininema proteolyticum]|uniref:Exo-alpha-sialidase n=1 Tax=Salininema proteolyticum TaxID=1607685 RepID=A0ABV8U4C7_9ACTN
MGPVLDRRTLLQAAATTAAFAFLGEGPARASAPGRLGPVRACALRHGEPVAADATGLWRLLPRPERLGPSFGPDVHLYGLAAAGEDLYVGAGRVRETPAEAEAPGVPPHLADLAGPDDTESPRREHRPVLYRVGPDGGVREVDVPWPAGLAHGFVHGVAALDDRITLAVSGTAQPDTPMVTRTYLVSSGDGGRTWSERLVRRYGAEALSPHLAHNESGDLALVTVDGDGTRRAFRGAIANGPARPSPVEGRGAPECVVLTASGGLRFVSEEWRRERFGAEPSTVVAVSGSSGRVLTGSGGKWRLEEFR